MPSSFPVIKTSISELTLVPLSEKHVAFLLELYNDAGIQKTLYRTGKKIGRGSILKQLEHMYEKSPAKEVVYLISHHNKPVGYVKAKLFDWENASCYISIATINSKEVRGKGLAIATYHAFFPFLEKLGIHKVYGRTFEGNTATVKLNLATEFRFIGRQTKFLTYKDGTSQDALFFEHHSPQVHTGTTSVIEHQLQPYFQLLKQYHLTWRASLAFPNKKAEIASYFEKQGMYTPRISIDSSYVQSKILHIEKASGELEKLYTQTATDLPRHWQLYMQEIAAYLNTQSRILKAVLVYDFEPYQKMQTEISAHIPAPEPYAGEESTMRTIPSAYLRSYFNHNTCQTVLSLCRRNLPIQRAFSKGVLHMMRENTYASGYPLLSLQLTQGARLATAGYLRTLQQAFFSPVNGISTIVTAELVKTQTLYTLFDAVQSQERLVRLSPKARLTLFNGAILWVDERQRIIPRMTPARSIAGAHLLKKKSSISMNELIQAPLGLDMHALLLPHFLGRTAKFDLGDVCRLASELKTI